MTRRIPTMLAANKYLSYLINIEGEGVQRAERRFDMHGGWYGEVMYYISDDAVEVLWSEPLSCLTGVILITDDNHNYLTIKFRTHDDPDAFIEIDFEDYVQANAAYNELVRYVD
jgi:hypothetical protein